jgi:hypothetical protein
VNKRLGNGDSPDAETIGDRQASAGIVAERARIVHCGWFGIAMRDTHHHARGPNVRFAKFDAAEIADRFALERLAEAAAAPEHQRRRDDQPQEGVALKLDMVHGVLLALAFRASYRNINAFAKSFHSIPGDSLRTGISS